MCDNFKQSTCTAKQRIVNIHDIAFKKCIACIKMKYDATAVSRHVQGHNDCSPQKYHSLQPSAIENHTDI